MEGETKILAWHFLPADGKLSNGDGRSVTVGETLSVTGRIECCDRGLHASVSAFDAMQHAPGPIICRVEVWGDLDQESDKVAGRHRKVLWMADASTTLRLFACECAERALTPFESRYPGDARPRQAIEVARRFAMGLASEDELDAARDAARNAARDAARNAARDAARDAEAAAWAAARDATEAAVEAAAWATARAAARDIEYKWQTNRLAEMLDGLASCES